MIKASLCCFRLKKWKRLLILPLLYLILTIIFNIIGEKRELIIPVVDATSKNWDKSSYWFYPWGEGKVHLGIDIFAPQKTLVVAPVSGIVVGKGFSKNGGNYVYLLGPRFRIYYFAHLNSSQVKRLSIVKVGEPIGKVGNSGNAISMGVIPKVATSFAPKCSLRFA